MSGSLLGAIKHRLAAHRFVLFAVLSLGLSYGWLMIEAGDVMFTPAPLDPLFVPKLFVEYWYTMLPSVPLLVYTARVSPVIR